MVPMLKIIILSLLLPGCSLLFENIDDTGDIGDAIEGSEENIPDVGGEPGPGEPGPGESWICDPFTETDCYVGNDPLNGPDYYEPGAGLSCSSCEQSSDCSPGSFCTGYTDAPGTCVDLCDDDHGCAAGSCLGVQFKGFGFCTGMC